LDPGEGEAGPAARQAVLVDASRDGPSWAALASVLGRPAMGPGGIALVTGGAGIGKSRLVATELAATAADRRGTVAAGFG
jgi:hypothetical protein